MYHRIQTTCVLFAYLFSLVSSQHRHTATPYELLEQRGYSSSSYDHEIPEFSTKIVIITSHLRHVFYTLVKANIFALLTALFDGPPLTIFLLHVGVKGCRQSERTLLRGHCTTRRSMVALPGRSIRPSCYKANCNPKDKCCVNKVCSKQLLRHHCPVLHCGYAQNAR